MGLIEEQKFTCMNHWMSYPGERRRSSSLIQQNKSQLNFDYNPDTLIAVVQDHANSIYTISLMMHAAIVLYWLLEVFVFHFCYISGVVYYDKILNMSKNNSKIILELYINNLSKTCVPKYESKYSQIELLMQHNVKQLCKTIYKLLIKKCLDYNYNENVPYWYYKIP